MEHAPHEMNTLGAFNHTNLHTHGLHVSPAGNSDNVLLDIAPQTSFDYEIKIPMNQVPGTYWYHAHLHGSTATQVSSGMAGALIVMGDQVKDPRYSPNIDQVPEVKNAQEKIFVFQQIIYDEFGQLEPDRGPLQTFPTYNAANPDNQIGYFGPCNWEPMQREHVINGQLFPTLTMAPGEVQRWRFIDAGIRETMGVQLIGPYPPGEIPDLQKLTEDGKLPIADPKKIVKLHEIAVDGIALDHVNAWDQVELEPGYRSDVMVQLNTEGTYYLVDTSVLQVTVTRDPNTGKYITNTTANSFSLTCGGSHELPGFLATIVVSGAHQNMKLPTTAQLKKLHVPDILKPIVTINTDKAVQPNDPRFLVALEKIGAFQKVDFTLAVYPAASATEVASLQPGPEFMAADHPFDPQNTRRLKLGNTDEWVLNTNLRPDSLYYGHPFHIHINAFQTWRPGPPNADGITTPELVWRDTIMVYQGVTTYVFTRYTDYTGAYVYHCHILDHEDQGMMEIVEVMK
jgi:FtsP/CotA-like multicopper oxidase with cupredoxin domain